MKYLGVIIEESLENKDVLKDIKILSTKIEDVEETHHTPWLTKWTLDTVEIPEKDAETVAKRLSKSLESGHNGSWYADYKNDQWHYIVFRDKIFKIDRKKIKEYEEARKYGISLGIPEYQVDFVSNVIE
jgi:hypothetical protein